jgi:hypothetical protein
LLGNYLDVLFLPFFAIFHMSSTQGYADESADKAIAVLKKAASSLQSAKSLAVRAIATVDEVESTEDFKLQKTFNIDVKLERSGKLYTQKSGDKKRSGRPRVNFQVTHHHSWCRPDSSV